MPLTRAFTPLQRRSAWRHARTPAAAPSTERRHEKPSVAQHPVAHAPVPTEQAEHGRRGAGRSGPRSVMPANDGAVECFQSGEPEARQEDDAEEGGADAAP